MGSLRLDDIILSSFHEAFKNREKKTASLVLSGTVPAFDALSFTTDVAITRDQASFEVFYKRSGSYDRHIANNSIILQDITWGSGNSNISVYNPSANVLRIQIYVSNSTGAPVALTSQTYDFTIYVFDTPFSA